MKHTSTTDLRKNLSAMMDRVTADHEPLLVTRWFGGTHLGGDRFRRVQDCVTHYLDQLRESG